jgi:hypothetical protein
MGSACLRALVAPLQRFHNDVRGSVLPIMGAAFFVVLIAVGSAIDIGRIYLVHAQMQAGVDAAALAGARSFEATGDGPESRDSQVEAYFRENFPEDYLGSGLVDPEADFRVERGINITEVTATTQLPMIFMHLFGVGPHEISTKAVAELQPRPLEIMVVLDDTGSMKTPLGGRTRMAVLKEAMHEFVNVLYQGSENREELALGIVTYTLTTNVGRILEDADVPIQAINGYTSTTVRPACGLISIRRAPRQSPRTYRRLRPILTGSRPPILHSVRWRQATRHLIRRASPMMAAGTTTTY